MKTFGAAHTYLIAHIHVESTTPPPSLGNEARELVFVCDFVRPGLTLTGDNFRVRRPSSNTGTSWPQISIVPPPYASRHTIFSVFSFGFVGP